MGAPALDRLLDTEETIQCCSTRFLQVMGAAASAGLTAATASASDDELKQALAGLPPDAKAKLRAALEAPAAFDPESVSISIEMMMVAPLPKSVADMDEAVEQAKQMGAKQAVEDNMPLVAAVKALDAAGQKAYFENLDAFAVKMIKLTNSTEMASDEEIKACKELLDKMPKELKGPLKRSSGKKKTGSKRLEKLHDGVYGAD